MISAIIIKHLKKGGKPSLSYRDTIREALDEAANIAQKERLKLEEEREIDRIQVIPTNQPVRDFRFSQSRVNLNAAIPVSKQKELKAKAEAEEENGETEPESNDPEDSEESDESETKTE